MRHIGFSCTLPATLSALAILSGISIAATEASAVAKPGFNNIVLKQPFIDVKGGGGGSGGGGGGSGGGGSGSGSSGGSGGSSGGSSSGAGGSAGAASGSSGGGAGGAGASSSGASGGAATGASAASANDGGGASAANGSAADGSGGAGSLTVAVDGVGLGSVAGTAPAAGPGTAAWIRIPRVRAPTQPLARVPARSAPDAQAGLGSDTRAFTGRSPPSAGQQSRAHASSERGGAAGEPSPPILVHLPMSKPPSSPLIEPTVAVMSDAEVPAPGRAAAFATAAPPPPVPAPLILELAQSAVARPGLTDNTPAPAAGAPAGQASPEEIGPEAPAAAPALAPPVAMVASPFAVAELAREMPRRYGGRTLFDLVMVLIPIAGVVSAGLSLYWVLAWLRDSLAEWRQRRTEARVEATRRRIAAVAPMRQMSG